MILITAANGQLGRGVVNALLKQVPPGKVAVGVRDKGKAQDFSKRSLEVRHCDYDDFNSLEKAFKGVSRMLFISSPVFDDRVRIPQHERVVKAAIKAGVGHVVYTSFLGSETEPMVGPRTHYVTERELERSRIPYTCLRNPFYTDGLLPVEFLRACIESGEIKEASGGRAVNSASYSDLAEAAAVVLSQEALPKETYELTGIPWTFSQLAEALGQISGRTIVCREMETGELSSPWDWLSGLTRSGALEQTSDDLGQLLGRSAIGIDQFITMSLSNAST